MTLSRGDRVGMVAKALVPEGVGVQVILVILVALAARGLSFHG